VEGVLDDGCGEVFCASFLGTLNEIAKNPSSDGKS